MTNPRGTNTRTFIGRANQIDQLNQHIQEVVQGEPRIWLIQGEPGIGKTRFLKEVETVAENKGLQVYKGRCIEDLTLPYLPFTEALFPRLEQGFDDSESIYEDDLATIRHLRRGHPTPSTPEQADQDKYRLFLAVSRAVMKLARQSPTLFIVDDLHWADQPSLDLFSYLGFALTDQTSVPLLMLGTHRPIESDTRLDRLISRFAREPLYRSLSLTGLNEHEIHDFLNSIGLQRPSQQLIRAIYETTQGNPLFIQEIVHYLTQKGDLQERGGYLVANRTNFAAIQLPKDIQATFTSRIKALSEDCARILAIAAVIGERFTLELLQAVYEEGDEHLGDERFFDALEEGIQQGILLDEDTEFQFAHALLRQAFYKSVNSIRRRRIHLKIAGTLEPQHTDNPSNCTLELAHHLISAGSLADSHKLLTYAEAAGDRAYTMFAWGDAARYYEAAITARESAGQDLQCQADLYYKAGAAHRRNQDTGPCLDRYDQASEYYKMAGDQKGLACARMQKTLMDITIGPVPYGTLVDLAPLLESLENLDDDDSSLRGHIAAVIAQAYQYATQSDQAKTMVSNALELGRRAEDHQLCARACNALAYNKISEMEIEESIAIWEQCLEYARQAEELVIQSWPLINLPASLTLLGRLEQAESVALEGIAMTNATQDWGAQSKALSHLACVAVARGDFALAETRSNETLLKMHRSRYPWGGARALPALACAHAYLGQWNSAAEALDRLVEPEYVFTSPNRAFQVYAEAYRALLQAYASETIEAPIENLVENVMAVVTDGAYSLAPLAALIELVDFADMPEILEAPYQKLAQAADHGIVLSSGWMFLIPRVLGIAASLQQRWEQAESHFQHAIEIANEAGMEPELGRTYFDYGRMLASHDMLDQQVKAEEVIKQAIDIFNRLGMQPFVYRATLFLEGLLSTHNPSLSETSLYRDYYSVYDIDSANLLPKEYTSFLS